ncbi:MAG: ADP-ribosylglycohydrolase family protein [Ilumatobacteraceae bacterium]
MLQRLAPLGQSGDVRDEAVIDRAIGWFGAAVGDALGAPFEFGPPGAYSARFPNRWSTASRDGRRGQLRWAPGQFTDDTERRWWWRTRCSNVVASTATICRGAASVGPQCERRRFAHAAVLDSNLSADRAAFEVAAKLGRHRSASNGSLMRAAPGALFFAGAGRAGTQVAGFQLSAVTHADPRCQWMVAVQHELVRCLLGGDELEPALRSAIETVPPVVRVDLDPVLDSTWHPADGGPSNNTAIGAFAQSVWALRTFDSFERAVTAVIDLGGDTDTVAAIAGANAGARFGAHAIPERWRAKVHGYVPTDDGASSSTTPT